MYTTYKKIMDILSIEKELYDTYFKVKFEDYIKKQNVSAFKKCITEVNKVAGVLIAYKLFYVGCSRARSELEIYITSDKIASYSDDLINKFKSIGFEIKNTVTAKL